MTTWRWLARVEAVAQLSRHPRYGTDAGAGVWLYLPGRMLRVWASWGTAPGSHMGLWRTRLPSSGLDGWNYRVGRWPKPTLTLLAHTRKIAPESVNGPGHEPEA